MHNTAVMDLGDAEKSTGLLRAIRKGNPLATFYTFGTAAKFPGDLIDIHHLTKLG
ncbi:hypothetical protein ABZ766_15760 [Streptomyces sp. NPDC006670]|uniref:hypothetical protein n=1 Tax=Streptomyces sp. NPDC006670 TaxID=3154476 RepID=UPI0033C7EDE5